MTRWTNGGNVLDGQQTLPLRIEIPEIEGCHDRPRILVRSMPGGYVTANCERCRSKRDVAFEAITHIKISASCPGCRANMTVARIPSSTSSIGNYGLKCTACDVYVWLSDLVPDWTDL